MASAHIPSRNAPSPADGQGVLRPGPDQPKYCNFGITRLKTGESFVPVITTTVAETPFYTLRSLCRADRRPHAPLLLVPPLSGPLPVLLRDLALDLLPDFDVHILDWANVRHVPTSAGRFGFEENIRAIVDSVLKIGPAASVVALCQSGVPSLAAAAHLSRWTPRKAPAHLVLMGVPVDPSVNPGPITDRINGQSEYWYDIVPVEPVHQKTSGHGRWVYPARYQYAALNEYIRRHGNEDNELGRKLHHDDGVDPQRFPFRTLCTAIMDLDATLFSENITTVFLRRDIACGTLRFRDHRIDPAAIRSCSLLTIEGGADDVVPPGQTEAAHSLCANLAPGRRDHAVIPECGHYGLFYGDICRKRIVPLIRAHCLETDTVTA